MSLRRILRPFLAATLLCTGVAVQAQVSVMLPANPGFYHRPARIEGLVDFIVARTLDHPGIDHDLIPPWGDGDDTA